MINHSSWTYKRGEETEQAVAPCHSRDRKVNTGNYDFLEERSGETAIGISIGKNEL
jgi:hypothetical protein